MDEESLQASFDCLGLNVDASLDEVERSFLELRNLYSEETLATYSLFDEADRQEKLQHYTQFKDTMTERTWINLVELGKRAEALIELDNELLDILLLVTGDMLLVDLWHNFQQHVN